LSVGKDIHMENSFKEAWLALDRDIRNCSKCPLRNLQQAPPVPGEGDMNSALLIVGEALGGQEVAQGRPFVGKAGIAFREILEEAGIPPHFAYITNTVLCRPTEIGPTGKSRNRPPDENEIKACKPWLDARIKLMKPKFIICVGAVAARALISPSFSITRERGLLTRSIYDTQAIATLHPAYLVRKSGEEYKEVRSQMVSDLIIARKACLSLLR